MRYREYRVYASSHFFRVDVKSGSGVWRGRMRIRQMTIDMFRRYFGGREPSFSFGKDGFEGCAWDLRGNHIHVIQENGKWAVAKYQPPVEQKEAA